MATCTNEERDFLDALADEDPPGGGPPASLAPLLLYAATARAAHETEMVAGGTTTPWSSLSDRERWDACLRAKAILAGEDPEGVHAAWFASLGPGWTQGPYDPIAKTHPRAVPNYEDLPADVRARDQLAATVTRGAGVSMGHRRNAPPGPGGAGGNVGAGGTRVTSGSGVR